MLKSFAARLSITFFLLISLVLAMIFTTLYFRAIKLRDVAVERNFGNFITLSSRLISGEEIQAIPLAPGCEKLPATQALIKKLQEIRRTDKALYDAYVMVKDPDPAFLRFVTNADRDQTPVGCGERYSIREDPNLLIGFTKPHVELEIHSDKWGSWLSAYAPIKSLSGETVGILGIDIAEKTVAHFQATFLKRFFIALAVCLLFSLVLGIAFSIWLTKPVRKVVQGMEIVAKGNLDHKLEYFRITEFDRIATIFDKMTASLKKIMRDLEITTRENERVRRELEIATEIQQAIFPKHPPEVEGLEIEAKSVPAKEVGGDYFDFLPAFPENKNRMGFIIADAAGKGLPGTLYMTRSRSIFKVIASEANCPGETLSRSNAHIASDTSSQNGMFITVLYLIYDQDTQKMTYANAGHYHPIWYQSNKKKFGELHTAGIPIGISSGQQYSEETLQLASGDILVMYTDGVIEARAENAEMFGINRLREIISQNSLLRAHELFSKIEHGLQEFIGQAPAFDDMTLIVIRVK